MDFSLQREEIIYTTADDPQAIKVRVYDNNDNYINEYIKYKVVQNNTNISIWDSYILDNGDIATADNLDTSILFSLFIDARADSTEVFDASKRRGWIGDLFSEIPNRKIGSKFWLLEQERLTNNVRASCIDYGKSATQWLIDDGYYSEINVVAEIVRPSQISLKIEFITDLNNIEIRYFDVVQRTNII